MATPQYIKPSSVKDIIPPTTNTGVDINTQVGNIKKQYGNMNSEQLYGAMLDVKPPAQQDILQSVGTQYGYNDRIAGLRQQAWEIQRQMLADQSALFAATNPDGTPVDPRVKVSQFQENLTRGSQRLQQIQKIQDVYATEMQTLAGAIADQYKAKAQDTQTAIQFMQQLNQEKNADRSFGLQKDQFEFQKSQAEKAANEWKWTRDTTNPDYIIDSKTGETQYKPLKSWGSFADSLGIIVGDYEGNRGRDFAGKLGEPVQAGGNWKVKSVIDTNYSSSPYGNSVVMVDENGNEIRYSHLQSLNVKPGDTLSYGSIVGERGNTGNVLGKNGEKLTAEQLKAGRGAHVDVEIKDATGKLMDKYRQMEYLGSIKAPEQTDDVVISGADIALFNGSKYNPQTDKDKNRVKRYEEFQNKSAEIMSDPNIDILEKMKFSQGSKSLTESPSKAYKDMGLVVSQLSNLKWAIDEYNDSTWFGSWMNPIQSIIANKNPWNTKAQEVKARLQAIVPKIARGIFGEVGVLTDQDIANYMQTLPNIKQTASVQDVVQLALLETLKSGLDNNISVDSATYDTSGLVGNYKKLTQKIGELQKKVVDDAPEQNQSIPGLPPWRYQSQTWTGVGRWQQSNQ